MTTITLPPEIETPLAEEAQRQGTTTELLTLDKLRALVSPTSPAETERQADVHEGETLADFLADFIGVLHSSEYVPGGAQMSVDSGKKFTEGMVKKRKEGHL